MVSSLPCHIPAHAEQIQLVSGGYECWFLASSLDLETWNLLDEEGGGAELWGWVCVPTWHCWMNDMTPLLKSFNSVKVKLSALRKNYCILHDVIQYSRGQKYVKMTLKDPVLNLVFFSQIPSPHLISLFFPSFLLSLCRSCLQERPPTENTIPLPMVLCCQDRERPLAW